MEFPQNQIADLVKVFPGTRRYEEAGYAYFFVPDLVLPEGCHPERVDALLCPSERDGYPSRLFFSQQIRGPVTRNWNTTCRILERTWHAFSWKIDQPGLCLVEMVLAHRGALQ
jgi:hypothetical protein